MIPKVNGTLKTLSIIVITLAVVCGVVWGLALRSGKLDHVVATVGILVEEQSIHKERTTELEKAVILIQSNYVHIQEDLTKIIKKLDE